MPTWNIVLFRWHNTFADFLGVLIFLIPLTILQVTLILVDHVSAWLVLVYLLWVIGYDIPWAFRLWRLNPPHLQPFKYRFLEKKVETGGAENEQ